MFYSLTCTSHQPFMGVLPCRPRDSSSVEQGVKQALFHQLISGTQHAHSCPLTPAGAQQGDVWNRVLVGKTIQMMTIPHRKNMQTPTNHWARTLYVLQQQMLFKVKYLCYTLLPDCRGYEAPEFSSEWFSSCWKYIPFHQHKWKVNNESKSGNNEEKGPELALARSNGPISWFCSMNQ